MNQTNIDNATGILRLMNKRKVKQIIDLLNERGESTVTDIMIRLRSEQSEASRFLAIMRQYDLVIDRRDEKNIYYSLNLDRIESVSAAVSNFVNSEMVEVCEA